MVSDTGISMHPPENHPQLKLLRERDFMIMDRLITMEWTPNEIACFNRCRLYVQCTTAADILTGDSKYIRKEVWTGKISQYTVNKNMNGHSNKDLEIEIGLFGEKVFAAFLILLMTSKFKQT